MRTRSALLLAAATLALAGCKEAKPAANSLDALDNRLVDGTVTAEGKALKDAIRVDPARAGRGAGATAKAEGGNCIERYGDRLGHANDWAGKLPPGLALPRDARIDEAAGRDGRDCAIRIVSLAAPGQDRDAVAAFFEKNARAAGYDAGRETRGPDLVVAGTKGEAAYMAMIGAPRGGSVPVDWVWSSGG